MVVGVGWVKEMDAVASENDGVMFEAGCDWTHIAGVAGGSINVIKNICDQSRIDLKQV